MDVWLAQDVARKDGKGRIGILIWMILDAMDRREGYSKFQEKRVAEMLPFFLSIFVCVSEACWRLNFIGWYYCPNHSRTYQLYLRRISIFSIAREFKVIAAEPVRFCIFE